MRFRLARWIMRYRGAVAAGFLAITAAFAVGIPHVEIRTIFNDLLPRDDPFVQVFFDHRNFGNPLTMSIMVKRKEGDIYNPETLAKVYKLTRDIDLTPGIDHDQLISISTEKLRYSRATPFGIDAQALMGDQAPVTPEEMEEFRRRVDLSPSAQTFYISWDETATIINASFQDSIDYGVAFAYVQDL
ncbi:MAG TPA: RND transporter, partial [Gammaproteobacteria bacterium]|nr:RND transporter [Gammaproteobacteria bacterium]